MKVTLNGREVELAGRTAFEVREQVGEQNDVIIVNGFQLDEDCQISENDMVTIIRKGRMPNENELESMMMARHTPNVHKKIKEGKVAIAGLGGLGSHIAVMLARTGVGQLLLVDFDVVEPSNLNRQHYSISHLGMPKTVALKKQLREINPFVNIEIMQTKITPENIGKLFGDYDIICEAFDQAAYKAMLAEVALDQLPDVKVVAASGLAGYDSANLIKTIRPLQRLYVCGDCENEARPGRGLMSPRVQICAGHQANMVLRLLLGIEDV